EVRIITGLQPQVRRFSVRLEITARGQFLERGPVVSTGDAVGRQRAVDQPVLPEVVGRRGDTLGEFLVLPDLVDGLGDPFQLLVLRPGLRRTRRRPRGRRTRPVASRRAGRRSPVATMTPRPPTSAGPR